MFGAVKTQSYTIRLRMMVIILWAHRQRLSLRQTHTPPAAAVPCCRGTAASSPQSTRRGQSPYARLRRTRPTLTNIDLPNRLPSQRPFQLQPRSMPPYGVTPLPAGGQGRPRQQLARRQPNSLPSFATQNPQTINMRPAQTNARQNTPQLRRAGCFGLGRFSGRLCSPQRPAQAAYMPCNPSRCVVLAPTQPPVPKALRPPLHLSKRMAGSRGALPQMRASVRPLCV